MSAGQSTTARRAADVAGVAVFAALTIALGAIYIPLPFSPVPITGQTLGVLLAANVLGPRRGSASVALVLLLVAAGMPVLAGGRGGAGLFVGTSGGYFLGWLLSAATVGATTARLGDGRAGLALRIAINLTLGVFMVYLTGVPWLAVVSGRSLGEAIAAGMVPFLAGDIFKAIVAAVVADRVLAAGRRAGLFPVAAGAPAL